MSVNTPPTENIPIFDPSVFPSASGTALTIASGSKYFLTYPVAQGSEIFPSNVTLQSTLTDASGDVGTAGQILSSTGTGTNWINSSGTNSYIALNTSTLPTTLPIPTEANTYVYITGSTGGTITIPTTGVVSGTLINFRNITLFTINIAGSSYLPYSSISTIEASPYVLSAGCSATFYYNGSIWVQPIVDKTMLNFTVLNTCYASALASDNINVNQNHSAGSAVNIYTSLTTDPLYIGGGANTAVHTTGPIIIGSDSTSTGGINIGTGTNQTVPTVNTVNIGSATYATNVLGTLTTSSTINASGNITAGAGSSLIAPTVRNGANTGSISSTGVLTGTSVVTPSLNASANTTDVGICTTQTSGVLNIGTGARSITGLGGSINIGTGSGGTAVPFNIGSSGSVITIAGGTTFNGRVNTTLGPIAGLVSFELKTGATTINYTIVSTAINREYFLVVFPSAGISATITLPAPATRTDQIIHIRSLATVNITITTPSGSIYPCVSSGNVFSPSWTAFTSNLANTFYSNGTNWYGFN